MTHQNSYWINNAFCVEAPSIEDAREKAKSYTRATVTTVETLPYPATPRYGEGTNTPAFCYRPSKCRGYSACPNRPSCTS